MAVSGESTKRNLPSQRWLTGSGSRHIAGRAKALRECRVRRRTKQEAFFPQTSARKLCLYTIDFPTSGCLKTQRSPGSTASTGVRLAATEGR
jgi:hypothetical protein